MFDFERVYFYGQMLSGKGQKKAEGIAIAFDGLTAAPLYVWQVLIEKLIDTAR